MDLKHYFTSPLEAVKVEDDNMEEIAAWCGGRVVHDERPYVWVPVPEGSRSTTAFVGTWITRRCVISLKNEIKYTFSVFRADYFKKNYFDTPQGAIDSTWEKASRQKKHKKTPKQRAAEAIVKDDVAFNQTLITDETWAKVVDRLEKRVAELEKGHTPSNAFVENEHGQFEPMSEAIIVKAGEPFAKEVLQNAENNLESVVTDQNGASFAASDRPDLKQQASNIVRQHLGLTADALPDGDGLPRHLTESQLEGMDEADVEKVLNEEVTFVHYHDWTDVCKDVGCAVEEYDGGAHKQVFADKTFAISAFGGAVEIESEYENYAGTEG